MAVTAPVLLDNSPGFLRQGRRNVNATFTESLNIHRIDGLRKARSAVTGYRVALQQALDNEGFAIGPRLRDYDGFSFLIHYIA